MTGPVEEMAWCKWEAAYVAADHRCVGFGQQIPCPTAEGQPCGCCPADLAAQAAALRVDLTPEQQEAPAPTGAPEQPTS